jgi:hypothetical protein
VLKAQRSDGKVCADNNLRHIGPACLHRTGAAYTAECGAKTRWAAAQARMESLFALIAREVGFRARSTGCHLRPNGSARERRRPFFVRHEPRRIRTKALLSRPGSLFATKATLRNRAAAVLFPRRGSRLEPRHLFAPAMPSLAARPNPSLHLTCASPLRGLSQAGELKR